MPSGNLDISVRSDIKATVLRLAAKGTKAIQDSSVRALNRTASSVRTEASREIRQRYNLKASVIKANMRIVKATRSRLVAEIVATGKRIPLIEFGARAVNPWNVAGRSHRRRGGGVSAAVTKTRRLFKGAFIAVMPSGHRGVYLRQGEGRKIRQLMGISIPKAMVERQVNATLAKFAAQRFRIEFERDLKYRLGI